MVKLSEEVIGNNEEQGTKCPLNRRVEEYEGQRTMVSFVFVNNMQFFIDFFGYKFEGLMPVEMGKEMKRKAREIDFVVTNTTTSNQSKVQYMHTFAIKGIKNILI